MGDSDERGISERRRAIRVPVRAHALVHGDAGPVHGTVENLSQSGALVTVARALRDRELEIQLQLADGHGWVSAHTVRVDPAPTDGYQIAVSFDRVEASMRASIDAAIACALSAARRRPILVIDDRDERRVRLLDGLVKRGMTPLSPRTPLEAVDLLTRAQLHVSVCLLAPGFGVPSTDLAAILSDSFPWVTTTQIGDDLDDTVERTFEAWELTPVARMGAIG
jgi:hypothetical protein